MSRAYDVVVVGAGPAGVVAAAGFADQGADVLLLEADPNASKRLAGEWLHPLAAAHLARSGLLEHEGSGPRQRGRGFAFYPDDGGPAVLLPYPDGERALAMEHDELLTCLRARVAERPRVHYVPHARLRALSEGQLDYTLAGSSHTAHASLVVGADGRSSSVRAGCYGARHAAAAVSHMAGVLLEDVSLPHEGYGHVILGGPGPLLMYRVGERHVRLCLDVPVGSAPRTPEGLFHGFGPVLPHALRSALRAALEDGKVVWAANRLTPRTEYGRGRIALVGDAVGTTHPLSAAGMTLGVLDALALIETGDVDRYAHQRRASSRVPEVLAQALYEVVTRDDESASAVRAAMVRMWRRDGAERERTMRILAGQEQRRLAFAHAFTKVAGGALLGDDDTPPEGLRSRLRRAARLREWARYPLAVAGRSALTPPRPYAEPTAPRSLASRARAISGAVASGVWPRHPRVRRSLRELLEALDELDVAARADARDPRADRTRAAVQVLVALLDARCADASALERVARHVTGGFPYEAEVAVEAEAALRRYAEYVRSAPRGKRAALRTERDGRLVGADWDFCQTSLEAVSRSFSKPIAALPSPLREAVTCGYLLCRIADTIEDAPDVSAEARDRHFDRFVAALTGAGRATDFERAILGWPGTEAELALAARLAVVIRALDATPSPMASIVRRWVSEMVGGMRVYAHRAPGHDGLRAPLSVRDLERYCYFVAGTVGHMLTELFLEHLGALPPGVERTLRSQAESFGAGLQLVNILKDVTDDRARGWAFVPRELTDLDQLELAAMLDEARRAKAHESIEPLFELARAKLDDALEYILAIPRDHAPIRVFCLLPVWMAARTLVLARGNDDVFVPGRPVKIPRREVERLAAECVALALADESLRSAYAALWQPATTPRNTPSPLRGEHV